MSEEIKTLSNQTERDIDAIVETSDSEGWQNWALVLYLMGPINSAINKAYQQGKADAAKVCDNAVEHHLSERERIIKTAGAKAVEALADSHYAKAEEAKLLAAAIRTL